MSLLEVIIVVTGCLFVLFAIDLYQRKKFNFLHFLVFFGGTGAIVLFALRPDIMDQFGTTFGVARGSDLVVYISIIFLGYLYFELLNKDTKTNYTVSRIVSNLAIDSASDKIDAQLRKTADIKTEKDKYIFLIRAYNEGQVIGGVIEKILQAGFSTVVIVDDGSHDETPNIINNLQSKHPNKTIITLRHTINRGGGAANKTLFAFIKRYRNKLSQQRCVTFDADDQMQVDDMERFIDRIQTSDKRIFIGSRFKKTGKTINMPLFRKVILVGSRIVSYMFSGVWVTDTTVGYKVIHKDIISKIHLESDGFGYAQELLAAIHTLNEPFEEVGVTILYTEYSLKKGQKNSNAFKILKELIYKGLFFK